MCNELVTRCLHRPLVTILLVPGLFQPRTRAAGGSQSPASCCSSRPSGLGTRLSGAVTGFVPESSQAKGLQGTKNAGRRGKMGLKGERKQKVGKKRRGMSGRRGVEKVEGA